LIGIGLAFVVLLFGANTTYGLYCQLAALFLLLGAAAHSVLIRKTPILNPPPTALFWLLAVIMPIQSVLVGIFRGTFYQVWYGFAFMLAIWVSRILSRNIGISRIISIYLVATAVMAILCLAFETPDLVAALTMTETDTGLARFSPFENHPNLIGHIFGMSGSLAAVQFWLRKGRTEKLALSVLALVCLVFVIAASSRGGLVSGLFSAGLPLIFLAKAKIGWVRVQRFLLIGGSATITAGLVWSLQGDNWLYFLNMLQLESEGRRGLDSGLTGRMEMWPIVLDKIYHDGGAIFWGFGFRSWDKFVENGDIDNSFVELAHDSGYPIAILLFAGFIVALKKAFAQKGASVDSYLIICVGLFSLLEGVVARYILAIGNPASLVTLFVFCSFSIERLSSKPRSLHANLTNQEVRSSDVK